MQEYMKAISLNPNYAKSYYTLAVVLESMKNYEKALENYQKFIDKAPKNLNSFIEKAQTRIDSLQKEQILQKD
jgi:tetratricopeptide (TPR) repeat protein